MCVQLCMLSAQRSELAGLVPRLFRLTRDVDSCSADVHAAGMSVVFVCTDLLPGVCCLLDALEHCWPAGLKCCTVKCATSKSVGACY